MEMLWVLIIIGLVVTIYLCLHVILKLVCKLCWLIYMLLGELYTSIYHCHLLWIILDMPYYFNRWLFGTATTASSSPQPSAGIKCDGSPCKQKKVIPIDETGQQ